MLTVAFGESTMSKTRVYEWYKRFKEGREDEDDDRPGRPSTSITDDNVEQIDFEENDSGKSPNHYQKGY